MENNNINDELKSDTDIDLESDNELKSDNDLESGDLEEYDLELESDDLESDNDIDLESEDLEFEDYIDLESDNDDNFCRNFDNQFINLKIIDNMHSNIQLDNNYIINPLENYHINNAILKMQSKKI